MRGRGQCVGRRSALSGHVFDRFRLVKLSLLLLLSICIRQCDANRPPTLIRNIDLSVVNENTPIDSQVFQLVALDPEGSPVTYALNGTNVFRVDRKSGVVSVASTIDREQLGEHIHFTVIIEDQVASGIQNNVVKIPVTVYVIDENDNPPKFQNPQALNLTIPEDTEPGEPVSPEVVAQDPDMVGSILRVHCDGCSSQFHVQNINEPTSSQIRFRLMLTRPLIYRPKQSPLLLHLRVSDGLHDRSLPVHVRILDVQNRPPLFIGASQLTLREDTPILSLVHHVRAIDGDALTDDQLVPLDDRSVNLQLQSTGRRLAYFLDENPADLFTLDQSTGELRLSNQLDREADYVQRENGQEFVLIRVRAVEMDDESGQLDLRPVSSALNELRLIITDVNDQRPTFDRSEYELSVPEDVAPNHPLEPLSIHVQDKDLAENAAFAVRLYDPSGLFELRPADGQSDLWPQLWLKSNASLDYENPNHRQIFLTIEAKETLTKQKFGSNATIVLSVADVNDNRPVFDEPQYFATLLENAKPGTIVKSVQAKDADSNALTRLVYSLSGPEAHLFELEPTSGLLKVAPCATPGEHDCLDFEHSSKFELNVTADDGHGLSSSVPLEIQLLDANDHSPRFDVERVDVHVDEGSSEFERPLLLNATDADSSSLIVYSLELDSDPSPIDHNSMGDHRPADHFTTSFDDEPAASDLFTQPEIHQRSAHLPYNSTQAVAAQFAIDSRSGQIRLNRPIAYSAEPIRLKVRASDGVHSAFMRLHVHVRDTNDNAPYFRPIIRKLNVSELASRGDFVTQLRAQDADVGENARVSYSLHHPPADWRVESELAIDCRPLPALPRASDHFMIDEQSGVLSVSSALDFDLKAQYTLLVRARDHGQPARCGHALLHVHVLNENNKPPRLTPEVQLWHVPERTGLGSHVYTIEATDPDYTHSTFGPTLGSPPQLVFRIESVEAIDRRGNALTVGSLELQQVSRFFGVDPGGRVIVAQPLKHELAAQVILNVSVLDSGAPVPQVGYGQVRLTIDDYNDHAPVFDAPWTPDQPMYWFDVPEEQPIGTPLARLHAEDPDSRVARYVIEPNSSQFAIDQHTGQIVITSRLDYEAIDETHLQFNVVAYDDGNPRLSSMAMVHVRLQNINDHRPQFDRTEYEVTIDEHIDWNTAVLRVHAHDADKGMYGKVRYALSAPTSGTSAGADLSNGDALQFFYIEPETGVIRVLQGANIDREAGHRLFKLQVSATDGGPIAATVTYDPFSDSNMNAFGAMQDSASIIAKEESATRFLKNATAESAAMSPLDDLFSDESFDSQPHSIVFAQVRIHVADINDNAPKFAEKSVDVTVYDYSEAVFDLYESLSGASIEQTRALVVQLNATDADEGLNGLIRFKLIGNTWPGVFELEPNSGRLYASRTPLKLQPNLVKYRLEIEARDRNGAGKLFDRAFVNIQIKKVNRHAPKFRLPFVSPNGLEDGVTSHVPRSASNEVHILENLSPGTLVTVITAEDADDGPNGQLSYGIKVNGSCQNQTDEFEIQSMTGQLFSKTTFDRESVSEYRLLLCARDYLAEPQVFETLQSLLVRIIDVDDNEPQFDSQATFEFRVTENEPRGTLVGRLQAIDRDHLPKHRRIRYELLDGNQDGRFHLQPDTGLLQLNASLDREQRDLYELVVKAIRIPESSTLNINDLTTALPQPETMIAHNLTQLHQIIRARSYNPNDRSLALLRIHVLDLNDNAPSFEQSVIHVPAAFDTAVNTSLLHVTAIDADLSVNSTLTYSLVSIELTRRGLDEASDPVRPIPSPFRVHSDTGLLSVVQPLTLYPVGSRFKLHVQARERSAPYRIATAQVHVYVYERRQLIRFIVTRPPPVVASAKKLLERKLHELLPAYWRPMLTSVRARVDGGKARVLSDQSECLLLVVDERQLADLNVPQVIARLDSQAADAHVDFDGQVLPFEQVAPADDADHGMIGLRALTSGQLPLLTVLTQQLGNDTQMVVLVALLALIVVGLLCTFVSCCCLRSWYYQKLIERAERAQRASMMPGNGSPPLAKLPLGFGSEYGGTAAMNAGNGLEEIYGQSLHSIYGYVGNGPLTYLNGSHTLNNNGHNLPPNGTIRSTRAKTPASRQQVPAHFGTTKENPLWVDNEGKFYEQQELTVQMQDNV